MSTRPVRPLRLQDRLTPAATGNLLLALAALFVCVGAVTLYLTPYPSSLRGWQLWMVVGGWGAAWLGSFALLRRRCPGFDMVLFAVVSLLTGWGLVLQARLAPAMVIRQTIWLLLGCGLMCAAALTPSLIRFLRRYRYTLLTLGILLLGATLVMGVNPSGYGQQLWLGAFGFYLQPSEPLKLLLVIYLAAYLSEKRDLSALRAAGQPTWLVILGPMMVMVGVALLLLAWQQDLGAALLYYLTFVTMLSLAWGKLRYALLSLILFLPVAVAGAVLSSRVALRVSIWLDPWAPEQADRAFQILQSLYAFGAGGLGGQGLSQGFPGLIPAVHTDFVYAALVEEFGAAGGLALLGLFGIFVTRGLRQAQRSSTSFESLLAGGIAALVCVQTWVIVAGNAKLIPITGVTLPFLSYGGSSMVTMLTATGLLINLSTSHPTPIALSLPQERIPPLRKSAAQLGQGLLALLITTAIATGVWSGLRAEELQAYPTNPRYVLSEARIRRGRIVDRNQTVLADIVIDDDGYVTRTYPVPQAAAVVGYATIEYGTSGIEEACNARLRGEIETSVWETTQDALLHRDPVGRDVRLTIDARLQASAQEQLADKTGAVVLVDARTGEILALASSPIYESGAIVEEWESLRDAPESPFLNRATQGLSQPGTGLHPFILASGWERGLAVTPTTPLSTPVPINGDMVTCRRLPQQETWASALVSGCPAPFSSVAQQLGAGEFTAAMAEWGFLEAPSIALPTVATDLAESPLNPVLDALGQGQLLVTPLQMAGAIAALGNGGVQPPFHVLAQPQTGCAAPPLEDGKRVVGTEMAEATRMALGSYGGVVGHIGTALAGEGRRHAWFVGLNSPALPRYAVAVMVDRPEAPTVAADIGATLLRTTVNLQ